jgi:sulfite exporter TauE/SafE
VLAVAAGAALAFGFGAHCALMCGPLAMASARRSSANAVRYALGRLVSYAALGALAGSLGRVFLASPWARTLERGAAYLVALMLLVAGIRLWPRARPAPLLELGKGPRKTRIGSLLASVADEPLLLGALTALLPCGALYTALAAAAALGTGARGALFMASFAAVSGLFLGAASGLGRKLTLHPWRRQLLAACLFAGALIAALRPLLAEGGTPPCHKAPHAPSQLVPMPPETP